MPKQPESKPPFAVGDHVRSGYYGEEAHVVRRVRSVGRDARYESGWYASADGGEDCPHCKRPLGTPIGCVSAAHFTLAEPPQ